MTTGATYEPFGGVAGLTFGNSAALTVSYDQDYQLIGISTVAGSTTIQNSTYGYDPAGNITSVTDSLTPARSQTLTYDDLNRVYTASGLYGSQSYSYDGVGNRTSRVLGSTTETYSLASAANQIASISTSIAPFTPTPATYLSNGFQQRVQKVVGSTTTQFVYDRAGHLLEEADGTGTVQKEYIWLDDVPVALVDDTGASPVVYFIHTDQIDTPQKVTDGSANVVWDGVFDPFGNAASGTGGALMNLRFPGQYFDAESALNQNWFRSYESTTGRYIQSDPIGLFGGINTYAYALSNPVSNADPFGLAPNRGPGSARCASLLRRINNIEADIAKRKNLIAENPLQLPYYPPYAGAPARLSVQGHEGLVRDLQQNLDNLREQYKNECDCDNDGNPPSAPAPIPLPGIPPAAAPELAPIIEDLLLGIGELILAF